MILKNKKIILLAYPDKADKNRFTFFCPARDMRLVSVACLIGPSELGEKSMSVRGILFFCCNNGRICTIRQVIFILL
jgi:hypothetical protein